MFRHHFSLRRCSSTNHHHQNSPQSALASFLNYSSSTKVIRVKNKESTARDHLANERTFLAFSRTGLSFLAAALGLFSSYTFAYDPNNKLSVHPREVVPAVAGLGFNGVAILTYSLSRFLHVQRALETGEFIIAKRRFVAMVVLTAVVTTWSMSQIYFLEMAKKGEFRPPR